MFETLLETRWKASDALMQIDRELTETDGTQTVMASVHFDVVFTRSSVFADVSFGFCIGKLQLFQVSISRECSLLGGFDFGKARVASVSVDFCIG